MEIVSLGEFFRLVREFELKNPKAIRLDGLTAEDRPVGNRKPFAWFKYPEGDNVNGEWPTWKVHSDTHIDPVLRARDIWNDGKRLPFVSHRTNKDAGPGTRLSIRGDYIKELSHTKNLNILKIK